jgi:hypothetical protein
MVKVQPSNNTKNRPSLRAPSRNAQCAASVPAMSRSRTRRLWPWYSMAPLPMSTKSGRRVGGTINDAVAKASWRAERRAAVMVETDDTMVSYVTRRMVKYTTLIMGAMLK